MIDKDMLIENLAKEEQKILNVAFKSKLTLVEYTGALISLAFGILKDTLFKDKTEEEIRDLLWMWYAATTPHSTKCGEEFEDYKHVKQPDDTVH